MNTTNSPINEDMLSESPFGIDGYPIEGDESPFGIDEDVLSEYPFGPPEPERKDDAMTVTELSWPTNERILAEGVTQSNDTRVTGLNNNDLIIGPTGAGKTRGYVAPNIIHNFKESMIITDTKGNLCKMYGEYLKSRGYKVKVINFIDCLHTPYGYNPLKYIGYDRYAKRSNEQDILRLCALLCPAESLQEPYWEEAAQMRIASLIGLALERFTPEDQTMKTVCDLAPRIGTDQLDSLFQELATSDPRSFAVREHRLSTINKDAEKMVVSVVGIIVNALNPYSFDGAQHLLAKAEDIDISSIGKEKTALFLTISDNDRSLDRLINAFYAQALQELIRQADNQPSSALDVPVRFILDDFACNTVIPDFDKIITTIRSRNISVSLIVQDLSQLKGLYGESAGSTIANNCDTWLYLGGQDVETAQMLSHKLDKSTHSILNLGLDEAFLMRRGSKPMRVQKYDLNSDEVYKRIMARQSPTSSDAYVDEDFDNEYFDDDSCYYGDSYYEDPYEEDYDYVYYNLNSDADPTC